MADMVYRASAQYKTETGSGCTEQDFKEWESERVWCTGQEFTEQ